MVAFSLPFVFLNFFFDFIVDPLLFFFCNTFFHFHVIVFFFICLSVVDL